MNKGFTLLEILIVLAILTLLFSLLIPFSYTLYFYYIEIREIEKLILMLGELRRDSFLYNRENIVHEKTGILYLNDLSITINDFKFRIDNPILFLRNGTSTGGVIFVFTERNTYRIYIKSPLGEIWYEKS